MQVTELPPVREEPSAQIDFWPLPSLRRPPGSDSGEAGTDARIRALVVDDEVFARQGLCRLLKHEPDIEVVGTPASGRDAVEAINRLEPELVFLDVQMPGLDGFEVVNQIHCPHMPAIIFVTADQQSATRAFDVHALDYLVKPCTRDRFRLSLQRAREHIQQSHACQSPAPRNGGLDHEPAPKLSERLVVKSNGRILFLRLADLEWIEAADNYAELHVGQQAHLVRETLTALEAKLPAGRFLRISRSAIVNLECVKELHPMFHGEYVVLLRNGARLTLTRGYRDKLQQLGLP
jgi:two-component system, LytTR family, response regulator